MTAAGAAVTAADAIHETVAMSERALRRPRRRHPAIATAIVTAVVLVGLVLAPSIPAGAADDAPPASEASDGTLPPGQVTATQADDDEGTGPNAGGTAGLVVFAVVVTVILGGATVLYLKHRRPTTS